MANKTSKRTLTVLQVIELVKSIDVPVLAIEKKLSIPQSILARALKEDTKKPLPVKYELPLINFVKQHLADQQQKERKATNVMTSVGIDVAKKESNISPEDQTNKDYWYNEIRSRVVEFPK